MRLAAIWRLVRAGFVLAREGAFSLIDPAPLPAGARAAVRVARLFERRAVRRAGGAERLTRALNRLGPTYVKFGQTLATRPDIVGVEIANDLSELQDRMAPFEMDRVPDLLAQSLGPRAAHLTELSEPIAAASIAQVHKAILRVPGQPQEIVAVKILRPGVAERFFRDIESYYAGARLLERWVPHLRRLRPVAIVETLDRSARLELDLRFEAASISEFAENIGSDPGFSVPELKWDYVGEGVLTTSWIDAIPIRDHAAIEAAGIDRAKLATEVMQSFLRHAIRDGFFHADMHPGNLFADPKTGGVIAVDFGITGRITKRERRFLADILLGFITRDYHAVAKRHFEIGYVPDTHSVEDFALAIRAIGEPLHGRPSRDISMAHVLGQLLTVTEIFDMQTRPELILLQKTMVLVEGVARSLDPDLNMWTVAEPIVREWLMREAGPIGQIKDIRSQADDLLQTVSRIPNMARRFDAALADYHLEAARRQALVPRWMIGTGFTVFMLTCIALIIGALA